MTIILGIDPGVQQTGYALIQKNTLLKSGTLQPREMLTSLERHLWLLTKMQKLIAFWEPDILAYEEAPWTDRAPMQRLIGGIQALALMDPFPVLVGLFPSVWMGELSGGATYNKRQIALVIEQRLGIQYGRRVQPQDEAQDHHESNAVGIALVAQDHHRMGYLERTAQGPNREESPHVS